MPQVEIIARRPARIAIRFSRGNLRRLGTAACEKLCVWVECMRWKWPTFFFFTPELLVCSIALVRCLDSANSKREAEEEEQRMGFFLQSKKCVPTLKAISNMVRVSISIVFVSFSLVHGFSSLTPIHVREILLLCQWRRREKNSRLKFRCNYSAREPFLGWLFDSARVR